MQPERDDNKKIKTINMGLVLYIMLSKRVDISKGPFDSSRPYTRACNGSLQTLASKMTHAKPIQTRNFPHGYSDKPIETIRIRLFNTIGQRPTNRVDFILILRKPTLIISYGILAFSTSTWQWTRHF